MNTKEWRYVGLIGEHEGCLDETCKEAAGWLSEAPGFHAVNIGVNMKNSEPIIKAGFLEEQVKKKIKANGSRILSVTGHGEYHFFTYGLCCLADRLSERYGYIHIDHHCDSWRLPIEAWHRKIGCGSFVPFILEDTNATDFVFLGTSILLEDEYKWCDAMGRLKKRSKNLLENHEGILDCKKLEKILSEMECDDVYVTFDLDVMDVSEVLTGYHGIDSGFLSRDSLFSAINLIKSKKNIISADINGYSNSDEDVWQALGHCNEEAAAQLKSKSKQLYLDIAKAITE